MIATSSLLVLSLAQPSLMAPQDVALPKADPKADPVALLEDDTEALAPSQWPQWRGPMRDGQFAGPTWPDSLTKGDLEPLWSVEDLGSSYATPIVSDTHVFTVGTLDREEEVVRAFDRNSGEEVWVARWEGSMKVPFFAAKNGSWVRSTPAFDGESLYVGGMRDVLVCLDAATGKQRWAVDFADRHDVDRPAFGLVCSPLVDGDDLYIQAGAALEKIDKRTGKTIWRSMTGGTGMESAFSSPILADVAGERQLVVQSRSHMAGLDPMTGKVRWDFAVKAFRGMNILTPLPYGGGFFTATYGGRAQLLTVDKLESGFEVKSAWQHRAQGYMTSPVLIDGCAYLFTRSNRFASIPLEAGEGGFISEPTGDEYMSLMAQGDRILSLSDTGVLRLIRANPDEFEVLGEVQLVEGKTWAHLAMAGDQVFVREENSLHAFTWK